MVTLLSLDGCRYWDRWIRSLFCMILHFDGWRNSGGGAVSLIVAVVLNFLDVVLLLDRSSGVNTLPISVEPQIYFGYCKVLINCNLGCSAASGLVISRIFWALTCWEGPLNCVMPRQIYRTFSYL